MKTTTTSEVKVTYKKGEDRCSCCGAFIRNIIEVDGVPYGTTCVDAVLPRKQVNQIKKDFNGMLVAQELQAKQELREVLYTYFSDLPSTLLNRDKAFYVEYLQKCVNSPFYLKVQAVVEYRKLA